MNLSHKIGAIPFNITENQCRLMLITSRTRERLIFPKGNKDKKESRKKTCKREAFEEAGIIERLDIGDGRSRYEEAGEHHEHLIDVESGEIIEFQNEELEEMKRQVALNMGYELVDHRLELFGKKIKK